jgi:hypothetical protein
MALVSIRELALLPAGVLALLLMSCSSGPETAERKESEKAAEPVTGQIALYRMYQSARTWAPDAEVLKLGSMHLSNEVAQVPGKAAAWEATFTSAAKSQARSYTYSVIEMEPNVHKGAFAGPEEAYRGAAGLSEPFLIAAVKVDTDKAYQTARTKAADYEKKNPRKPISLLLERTKKFPNPAWRVIWGESAGSSNLSVYVDASTGVYLETMH